MTALICSDLLAHSLLPVPAAHWCSTTLEVCGMQEGATPWPTHTGGCGLPHSIHSMPLSCTILYKGEATDMHAYMQLHTGDVLLYSDRLCLDFAGPACRRRWVWLDRMGKCTEEGWLGGYQGCTPTKRCVCMYMCWYQVGMETDLATVEYCSYLRRLICMIEVRLKWMAIFRCFDSLQQLPFSEKNNTD